MPPTAQLLMGSVLLLAAAAIAVWKSVVIGKPDEWVLRIRNGRLINADIGIVFVRRPWDRVVRFSAAMQRVRFAAEPLSSESLAVGIEAFMLWSISPERDGPFRAFSKLRIVDKRELTDRLDQNRKHLLQKPQHHAFQQLLRAAVERLAPQFSLRSLLSEQDAFTRRLEEELIRITESMGVQVDGVQVLQIRPRDPDVLRHLATGIEQSTREEAARIQLETAERVKRREIESNMQVEQARLRAQRDQEIARARAALEAQQEKARLLEAENQARTQELEHQQGIALLDAEYSKQRRLAEESASDALQEAVLAREEGAFVAKLNRQRRDAEIQRDCTRLVAEAEESKSPALREYELAHLATVKLAESLRSLPFESAQWVTVGQDSPAETIASLLATGRSLLAGNSPCPAGSTES